MTDVIRVAVPVAQSLQCFESLPVLRSSSFLARQI